MADEPVFEVGLVLAGAVSAGAYTAGVIDFLTEALDAYEDARTTGFVDGERWDGPTHAVRIPVLAGASAGGMTAAMAALQLHTAFEHMGPGRHLTAPARNRLYAGWVDEVGIEPLLDGRDLPKGQRLRSVLSCTVLEDILARTLALAPDRSRAWLGRDDSQALAVLLTVSDTGGVPYRFSLSGAASDSDYTMLNHGSSLRFMVGQGPPPAGRVPGFEFLDLAEAASPVRARFGTAALATGAFPIGLAPRAVDRAFTDYRTVDQVGSDRLDPEGNLVFVPTPPVDRPPGRPERHRFVAVDGGVIDNEPLELARRFLARQEAKNPANRNGVETKYAVVLIDPFPNRAAWPEEPGTLPDILSAVAPRLVSMLIDQARFKPQELSLALNESVFSRFAILPEPDDPDPSKETRELPIACGALGGFSGFLHRSFRHHDYCLGRRNAQAFLRTYLCLPHTNPLFDAWKATGGAVDAWYVAVPSAQGPAPFGRSVPEDARRMVPETVRVAGAPKPTEVAALPIIPLTRRLREEIKLGPADRPRPDARLSARLDPLLRARLDLVVQRLVDDELGDLVPYGFVGRPLLKQFLPGILREKAKRSIDAALRRIARAFPD